MVLEYNLGVTDELSVVLVVVACICYFNTQSYAVCSDVCSGNELLGCGVQAVWVRKGGCYQKQVHPEMRPGVARHGLGGGNLP